MYLRWVYPDVSSRVYLRWCIPGCISQVYPRVYLRWCIPRCIPPICLPTTVVGIHPPYMPPLPIHPGYTHHPHCCTGVPGHGVHHARCPGGEALGSTLRLIREERPRESLRTLRVLTREGGMRAELLRSSWLTVRKDWIDLGPPSLFPLWLGPVAHSLLS